MSSSASTAATSPDISPYFSDIGHKGPIVQGIESARSIDSADAAFDVVKGYLCRTGLWIAYHVMRVYLQIKAFSDLLFNTWMIVKYIVVVYVFDPVKLVQLLVSLFKVISNGSGFHYELLPRKLPKSITLEENMGPLYLQTTYNTYQDDMYRKIHVANESMRVSLNIARLIVWTSLIGVKKIVVNSNADLSALKDLLQVEYRSFHYFNAPIIKLITTDSFLFLDPLDLYTGPDLRNIWADDTTRELEVVINCPTTASELTLVPGAGNVRLSQCVVSGRETVIFSSQSAFTGYFVLCGLHVYSRLQLS